MSRFDRVAAFVFAALLVSTTARAGNGPAGPSSVSGPPAQLSAGQRNALAAKDAERMARTRAFAPPASAGKTAPVTTVGPPGDRATADRALRSKALAVARQHKIANVNDRSRQDAATSMGVERARSLGLIKSPDRGVGLTPAPSGATHGGTKP